MTMSHVSARSAWRFAPKRPAVGVQRHLADAVAAFGPDEAVVGHLVATIWSV
jgi:hypothetical protein